MLGIAYAASLGGIGTKIGTGTNLIFVKQAEAFRTEGIDFLTWLKVGLPVAGIALPGVWLYLVRIAAPLPAEAFPGGGAAVADARARLGRMGRGEAAALAAFLAAAGLWVFRNDIDLGRITIPGWWDAVPFGWADVLGRPVEMLPKPWPPLLRDVGDAAVALVCGGLLFVTPVGRRPLRFALGLREAGGISWGLLVLLGGGFAMAYGVKESGLSDRIGDALHGVGRLEPFPALLLVCFVTTALTEVASNTATVGILLPVLAAGAESVGLQPVPLMWAATISASFGFMLPAGTPPNAIVYSSGCIPVTRMARCGLVVDLGGVLLVAALCHGLAAAALGG
jgi:sodium-dependent dicarboxylate transporter 2/3/5